MRRIVLGCWATYVWDQATQTGIGYTNNNYASQITATRMLNGITYYDTYISYMRRPPATNYRPTFDWVNL